VGWELLCSIDRGSLGEGGLEEAGGGGGGNWGFILMIQILKFLYYFFKKNVHINFL
jgi:hypothetical protein